jgi:predicted ATPase/DNA-binding SARP family transcriptional activator
VAGPKGQLEIRILGPLEVVSGGALLPLGGQKQRAVLAILTIRAGTVISADELIELLWSGSPPATASTTVQVYVSRLRKLIGADLIATAAGGYVLSAELDLLDTARFEQRAARGRELRRANKPTEASAALTEALSLWRGPALADFTYESWAQSDIIRLDEQRLACLEERVEADLACGRDSNLVGELEALVAAYPLRERLRAQLMLALYRAGRQAEALEAYHRARATLVDELGIEPGPELQELNRKILTQDVSPAIPRLQPSLPAGTVTLLATDIEGSTPLLSELGPMAYAEALAEHRSVLRNAFAAHEGIEVDTQGDAFLVAFARASDAVAAAAEAQSELAGGAVRVRMGVHSGEPLLTTEGYVGIDVHQAARFSSAGHGGQVLISQSTHALLDSAFDLIDLGEHRLKDLTAAQRLYQLGEEQFPPLKTLHQVNLPVQPTPLIGRRQELDQVLELLSAGRLVTLTGAGGSGKTRLALQAAAELVEHYPDGVWWVSLAALRDPALVEPTIARVVGGKSGLLQHLRELHALLLLDNFEHLMPAAPDIGALLGACPELVVLATSRERLGLAAEQEYPVPTMIPAEAVELFTARARQLAPGFEPDGATNEICRRLDGLPLAIELAAARIKMLRPEQIEERLAKSLEFLTRGARDAPERQRTLQATIDWSYELLDAAEKELFAQLAVFAGGFELGAAEAVCEADIDTLGSLLDKSLLRQTPDGRFFMLETIREYALARFGEGEAAKSVHRRHADWFLTLAEEAAPELRGGVEQARWFDRLELEGENFRAALRWAEAGGDSPYVLRLCVALGRFWWLYGHPSERRWLRKALAETSGEVSAVRVAALIEAALGEGSLAESSPESHDHAHGASLAEEAVVQAREIGHEQLTARALVALGLCLEGDDPERALELYRESRELYQSVGDQWGVGVATLNSGVVALGRGDLAAAETTLNEALQIAYAMDDAEGEAEALASLGVTHLEQRCLGAARAAFAESLRITSGLGMPKLLAETVLGAAGVANERRDSAAAASLVAAADLMLEPLVIPGWAPERRLRERILAAARADLGEDHMEVLYAEGRSWTREGAIARAFEQLEADQRQA